VSSQVWTAAAAVCSRSPRRTRRSRPNRNLVPRRPMKLLYPDPWGGVERRPRAGRWYRKRFGADRPDASPRDFQAKVQLASRDRGRVSNVTTSCLREPRKLALDRTSWHNATADGPLRRALLDAAISNQYALPPLSAGKPELSAIDTRSRILDPNACRTT